MVCGIDRHLCHDIRDDGDAPTTMISVFDDEGA